MQIRIHAAAEPNKPATILYPSAKVVTFGALEARANQLAHYFRRSGLRGGDAIAILMENNEHIHAVMWAAAQRFVLRTDQCPSGRRGSRLHRG